ncbi:MAG TPA: DnaJ domain-containing protein [Bacteroidales bacterium]|nr:DnaJ domain-containing protein [Bacteroidales bacterium]
MTYFLDVKEKTDLKSTYRKLSLIYHPDKGGETEKMQAINEEYNMLKHTFGELPKNLKKVKVGNFVYVNKSLCMVFKVESKLFFAKSLTTGRVAMFAKDTGYGVFNFNFRAHVN